ncbi:MAG: MFS transporter [Pseudomonadota bacterium]
MTTSAGVEPLHTSDFFLLMASVFTVSLGYGIALPLLPFFLARVLADPALIPWHTGMLSGIYMLAVFVFAPLWGRYSDRIGRRPVILVGLGGLVLALALFGLSDGLSLGYLARILAGAFASAVLPVTLAYVADMSFPERRARRFAWMSAASLLGFLAGPALGGWLSGADMPMLSRVRMQGGMPSLPFLATAAIGFAVWLGCYLRLPEAVPARINNDSPPVKNGEATPTLLFLTLLAMFGLGSFEVGITLQGQQILALSPSRIGVVFVECSLMMLVAQALVFSPPARSFGKFPIIAAAFLVMAIGLAGLATAADFKALLFLVGMVSASSGILLPLLSYRVSLDAGVAQGAALGKQTAAASLGQSIGSAAAGLLFGMMPEAPFWITAGMLLTGVIAGRNTHVNLKTAIGRR